MLISKVASREYLAVLAGVQPRAIAGGEPFGGRGGRRRYGGDPLGDAERAPPGRGPTRRRHRGVELSTVGGGRMADDLGRPGRIVDGVAAGCACLRLAADRQNRTFASGLAFPRDRR